MQEMQTKKWFCSMDSCWLWLGFEKKQIDKQIDEQIDEQMDEQIDEQIDE